VHTNIVAVESPLRILLPVHHFLPHHAAGTELYTAKLARQLCQRGYQVEIVTIDSTTRGSAGELIEEVAEYDEIPVHRLSFNLDAAPDRDRWLFDNPLLGAWFERYFQTTKPDLVHFQGGYLLGVAPILAARASGVPSVLTLHDYWFLCPRHTLLRGDNTLCPEVPTDPAVCVWCNALMKRRYQVADRLSKGAAGESAARLDFFGKRQTLTSRRACIADALSGIGAIISPSAFMASIMKDVVDLRQIDVVRFGFEPADRESVPAFTQRDELRVGFIGQVNEHKGVHLLVEAFRRLRSTRPLRLDIYGNIPMPAYRQRLERLANGDSRIHFHGRFENAQVANILASFMVCVAPSIWYENSPIAIQEAQNARVPVITAALGGMQELVQDGVNGLHFVARSTDSLAAQLQRLLDEPDLLSRLQEGARATQTRSLSDEMDAIEALYQRVMSARCGGYSDV